MKLLKFINGDAPQQKNGIQWDSEHQTLTLGDHSPLRWTPVEQQKLSSCYMLVDDGGLLGEIQEVVVLKSSLTAEGKPKGVTAEHVKGVDFRNKKGKMLDERRAEFGTTYSNVKPSKMNEEILRENRKQANKRERDRVANAVDEGEIVAPSRSKTRKEKK